MFSMDIESIINKIVEKSKLDKETILLKIQQKQRELSNLVTEVGAAHIIANELGINLIDSLNKDRIQISNLLPNLRNVNVLGRVIYKNKVFEFNKNGKTGKVSSFIIGDETGKLKVVLWNDMVKILNEINEGDIIKIYFGQIKKNKFGNLELHITNNSKIKLNPNEDVSFIPNLDFFKSSFYERKEISSINENEKVEVKATIVYVSPIKFFEVCSVCKGRFENGKCVNGCVSTPIKNAILRLIIDDGTGTIYSTLFGNKINDLLINKKFEDLKEGEVLSNLVGKEFIFRGLIKLNSKSNNLELNVYSVENINYEKEINNILKN